jgi:putative ribosome biogenesis GTPase RsgA
MCSGYKNSTLKGDKMKEYPSLEIIEMAIASINRLIEFFTKLRADDVAKISDLSAKLAAAMAQPPAGREQLDAAVAEAEAAKAELLLVKAKVEMLEAEEIQEDADEIASVEAFIAANSEPVEPTPDFVDQSMPDVIGETPDPDVIG